MSTNRFEWKKKEVLKYQKIIFRSKMAQKRITRKDAVGKIRCHSVYKGRAQRIWKITMKCDFVSSYITRKLH